MSDYNKTYAQFNTLTITGRVSHTELVESKNGEFLAVTLLSDLKDDGEAVAVTFNTSNGLMSLSKKGFLNNGRMVTVTGHLDSFTELYFDAKLGKTRRLKRAKLHLVQAQVFAGGLGPAKKSDDVIDQDADIEVDEAPQIPVAAGADTPVAESENTDYWFTRVHPNGCARFYFLSNMDLLIYISILGILGGYCYLMIMDKR